MMPPAMTQHADGISCCFHHGRVSFTSYAMFSAPINEPKMFEPEYAVSTAPMETNPARCGRGDDVAEHAPQQRSVALASSRRAG